MLLDVGFSVWWAPTLTAGRGAAGSRGEGGGGAQTYNFDTFSKKKMHEIEKV